MIRIPIAISVIALMATSNVTMAGFHKIEASGEISVPGTRTTFQESGTDVGFGIGSSESTIGFGAAGGAIEEYEASVDYSIRGGIMRFSLEASATGGNRPFKPSASADVTLRYFDAITLSGAGQRPFDELILQLRTFATVEAVGSSALGQTMGIIETSILSPGARSRQTFSIQDIPETKVEQFVSHRMSFDQFDRAEFLFAVRGLMTTQSGYGRIDSSQSTELEGILFPDGSTPESHGFTIVFESGQTSPNLQNVVPEPQSMMLVAVGAILCGAFAIRRSPRISHEAN